MLLSELVKLTENCVLWVLELACQGYVGKREVVLEECSGEGHKTRRCRRVTYPESYVTKYTTFTEIMCHAAVACCVGVIRDTSATLQYHA